MYIHSYIWYMRSYHIHVVMDLPLIQCHQAHLVDSWAEKGLSWDLQRSLVHFDLPKCRCLTEVRCWKGLKIPTNHRHWEPFQEYVLFPRWFMFKISRKRNANVCCNDFLIPIPWKWLFILVMLDRVFQCTSWVYTAPLPVVNEGYSGGDPRT